MAFNFLPEKKTQQSPFATGMRKGAAGGKKSVAGAAGVSFVGGTDERPTSGNLLGHLKPEHSGNLWGMSRQAAMRFYAMGILFIVMLLAVTTNLAGLWGKIQTDLADKRSNSTVGSHASQSGDQGYVPGSGLRVVDDNPQDRDADASLQMPTVAGNRGTNVPVGAQPGSNDNQPGPDPGTGPGPVAPQPPPIDDPEAFQRERARLIAEGEEKFKTPRLQPVPDGLIGAFNITVDDVYNQDYGELHHHFLQVVNETPPERILASTVPDDEIKRGWYTVGHSESLLFGMVGRTFSVEGTLFELEQMPAAAFNLEDTQITVGGEARKITTVWRGLVAFGYDRLEVGEAGATAVRETGLAQFTSLGPLPDGVTAARVADRNALPLRVRVTGLFLHLRRHVQKGTGSSRVVPHLVAGPIEVAAPLPAQIDPVLMKAINTSTDLAREYLPVPAMQNLLYTLAHTPDAQQMLNAAVDETVHYGDLMHEPETYSTKPTVLRFEGQIGKYGTAANEPIAEYTLNPNPWGLRTQYTGAMVVLDERSQQQTVIFDALEWVCWDDKAQTHYNYREAKEGNGLMPCGDPIPKHPFEVGDEVIINGYFLTKWRYRTRGAREWVDVVRVVTHSIVQRAPRKDPVSIMKWIFVGIFVLILGVVFWLFRREQASATEFRRDFLSKHVRKARASKDAAEGEAKAAAGDAAAAEEKPAADTPPAADNPPPAE
ncbi:MAG: hypothetical protein AB7K09_07590 [Planctomycetota bacterium]